jgi:hypothetical protein
MIALYAYFGLGECENVIMITYNMIFIYQPCMLVTHMKYILELYKLHFWVIG